jgi:hypothetical protein
LRIDWTRAWQNKWTFKIPPIQKLLKEEMMEGLWIDPYSGMNSPATITNDINPEMPTKYHLDALEFVSTFDDVSVDGLLFDPPYSSRQISDCYKSLGLKVDMHTTQSSWYFRVIKVAVNKIKPNGKVISFGWNSSGMGQWRGFEKTRILLVNHGIYRNDTIVTVNKS